MRAEIGIPQPEPGSAWVAPAAGAATRTTCPYCGVGCGVLATVGPDGAVSIAGDPEHPANHGRLCSKGAALGETVDLDGRLLWPQVHGERVDWDTALDAVAQGLARVIDAHGPDAVAFYVSGQLLTEDYYVANKLMKGFIGSGNIDTNSRLCMASAVSGHQRAFGSDTVPCRYADLEEAELIVLVGANTAWCHPVVFQRIRAAKTANPKRRIVVIDPRRTPTCDIADLHLPLAPGTDVALFVGLLNYLRREDALDWAYLEAHCEGFAAATQAARRGPASIPAVAQACGLDPDGVGQLFRWFARTERTVTLYSQGVNQSSSGTDKVNAIINCHLATGRIGRPGMGPFSITGQPNAMGGREVGGLATMLAAHMDFAPAHVARVGRFWDAARMAQAPGLKAVELFEAIERGAVKAVWIMATNPVVSLPAADRFRAALKACELVVVSDCVERTDTTAYAHVRLPAATWGEKDGTVTNSERCLSRQRAFLPLPGAAQPDWWIVTQVARRLGFAAAFPYTSAAEVFREHAALSGFENDGSRGFDLGALAGLTDAQYAALAPLRWPAPVQPRPEPFADGHFFTPSGKARFVALEPRPPAHAPDADFPLILNTGRVRDQWHTMTRTAKSATLSAHRPEPTVEVHPQDARRFGLREGGLARVVSRWGEALVRVGLDAGQRPGSVFMPFHWTAQTARAARADALVNPVTDPLSGEPEYKHTPVRLAPWQPAWQAFLLTREAVAPPACAYWVKVKGKRCWRYELAGEGAPLSWGRWARGVFDTPGHWVEFADPATGRYRAALIRADALIACLFAGPAITLPSRDWLGGLFAKGTLDLTDRAALLAGRPLQPTHDTGPTVCACFGIGRATLIEAIRAHDLSTPAQLGERLQAGSNCGSCLPELHALILATRGERGG